MPRTAQQFAEPVVQAGLVRGAGLLRIAKRPMQWVAVHEWAQQLQLVPKVGQAPMFVQGSTFVLAELDQAPTSGLSVQLEPVLGLAPMFAVAPMFVQLVPEVSQAPVFVLDANVPPAPLVATELTAGQVSPAQHSPDGLVSAVPAALAVFLASRSCCSRAGVLNVPQCQVDGQQKPAKLRMLTGHLWSCCLGVDMLTGS